MTNYRDKFLGGKTVTVKTKDIDRKETTFLNEQLERVSDLSMSKVEKEIESANFIFNFNKLSKIIRPDISFQDPSTFAFYGSAKQYYEDGFDNITHRYPYDGSRNERVSWAISASALDILLLEHAYPKSTGHVSFSPAGSGTETSSDARYRITDKVEYVSFVGGPQVKSTYNTTSGRGTNLAIDATSGNTIEFWLRKKAFEGHGKREVIVDIHTPSAPDGSAPGHGRFLVELDGDSDASAQPLTFSYLSSSAGFANQRIGSSLTAAAIADDTWHHYALSVANSGSVLRARLYVDGTLNDTITTNTTLGLVESNTAATLGSLAERNGSHGALGWGKLSGSLDEFRYWKSERNPKQIGIYYDKPVYGGTINDNSNPDLGIYFKFNEGITGDNVTDAIVLDYSGRINNGSFVGYTPKNRSLDSAITLSSATKETETGDPIVTPTHPEVISKKENYSLIGLGHDRVNQTSLAKSLPQWVYDDDVFGASEQNSEMAVLIQAMSSEFDAIKLLIDNVLKINSKDTQDFIDAGSTVQYENTHLFGCAEDFRADEAGRRDNAQLADFALARESFFVEKYPITEHADYLEYFYSISEDHIFDQESRVIRDKILKNIHKNLVHIYKSKGTEESFRNMIRCFGVGESLIRLNVYAQNEEREIKDSPIYTTIPKKVVSFEGDNKNSNIIQQTSSAYPDAKIFISGTQDITPWSIESSFIFPTMTTNSSLLTTSLYGAGISKFVPEPDNQIVFNVSAVKHNGTNKAAYFKISSDTNLFSELTSSYFPEVYDNSKWNFAVMVAKDSTIPMGSIDTSGYKLHFIGKQYDLDVLRNSFHLTSSITQTNYEAFSKHAKCLYMGAERTHLTGTIIKPADTRGIFLNAWSDKLSDNEIKNHAVNLNNYGRDNPQFLSKHNQGANSPNFNSLVLSWHFDDNPDFDSSNVLNITDATSGSLEWIGKYGSVVGYKYPGKSENFSDTSRAIMQEHIVGLEYAEIDNAYTSERVKIKADEIEKFEIDSRPTTYTFSFEKSMYQIISKEMLNFVAGLASYNNIIGEPVNKYRQDYKALQKINDRFFETVNSSVDLDKFVEYYKWVDSSLGSFLTALQPASSRMSTDLKNVVESHAFERNKYQHPFPTVEFKNPNIPITPLLGVNELLYDWEHGSAPLPGTAGTPASVQITVSMSNANRTANNGVAIKINDGSDYVTLTFKSGGSAPHFGKHNSFGPRDQVEIGDGGTNDQIATRIANAINNENSDGETGNAWTSNGGAASLDVTATASGNVVTIVNTGGGTTTVTNPADGVSTPAAGLTIENVSASPGSSPPESEKCLWWQDRAHRLNDFSQPPLQGDRENRETLKDIIKTNVTGSTYVLRSLQKPYRYSIDRQDFLVHGSNRKANKIDEFYKIINSGHEITLSKDDIYDYKKCDDPVNPQRERIYAAKADTSGTGGYLDADADLLLPFTLYSSSAGVDFANFKQNLKITNNHDDIESSWAQSPFVSAHNGGMPHRRVPFGTPDAERPEAYDIDTTSTKLTFRQPVQKPKSMFYRETTGGRLMNISNVKHTTSSLLMGNYSKDYEIVMTNGRRENNNYFVDTEGSFLGASSFVTSEYIKDSVDFVVPDRGRTGHVIVNRFSAPGGPDSMGPAGLDRVAAEYSVNDTINYRNSMVRGVWDMLSSEYSGRHGYRTSSFDGPSPQASVHMTNRNPMRFTGSLGHEVNYDNFFVQHPIPQNDFGYAWITASAEHDVYEFLSGNANFGHQHMFNIQNPGLDSKETIKFLAHSDVKAYTISSGGGDGRKAFGLLTDVSETAAIKAHTIPVDFTGMNTIIFEPVTESTNILGYPALEITNPSPGGTEFVKVNYFNQDNIPGNTDGEQVRLGLGISKANRPRIAGEHAILNALILHRQGPYGWPSWKQIRGASHPVMREHRKNNTYSILLRGTEYNAAAKSDYTFDWNSADANIEDIKVRTDSRVVKNYRDMPVTSRFNAITMTKHKVNLANLDSGETGNAEIRSLIEERVIQNRHGHQYYERGLWNGDEYYHEIHTQDTEILEQQTRVGQRSAEEELERLGRAISIRATLPNDITTYANRQIIKDFDIDEMVSSRDKKDSFLKLLRTWYPTTSNDLGISTSVNLNELELREINYIETLYPKENNTYTKNARSRENFVFHGWNSIPSERQTFLTGNILYGGPGTFTGHSGLVVFPTVQVKDNTNFRDSSMGTVDMVNMGSIDTLIFGSHITSSTWPLDARKQFTSLPVSIDLNFRSGQETFLEDNTQGTRGEGLLQNDYGIFAMGYNGIHGTPPISMTYNRRIPQEIPLYSQDFNSLTPGDLVAGTHGWAMGTGEHDSGSVAIRDSSEGDQVLAFDGIVRSTCRRAAVLNTWFTGATTISFDLMAFAPGGANASPFNTAYGIPTLNVHAEPVGSTFDVHYALAHTEGHDVPTHTLTWTLAKEIPYDTTMKDQAVRISVPIPVSSSAKYRIRLSQVANRVPIGGGFAAHEPAGNHDRWLVDDFRVVKTVLSGEAKFQTADDKLGPFYDSYEDYRDEIKRVGQDHSVVPEFRMSEFVEEYYDPDNPGDFSRMRNEFLSLTGAVYHSSSGDLQVGSQFFKTYGTSEFMKYFEPLKTTFAEESDGFKATRLTLRCQAAMKFLPYKGFYPAERVEQLGEIFSRSYMANVKHKINTVNVTELTDSQKDYLFERRVNASKQQVMKPLFGPGVLNNSIKSGLAVDYPLFDTNFEAAWEDVNYFTGTEFLTGSIPKTHAKANIHKLDLFPLTPGDTITITSVDADGTQLAKTYTAVASNQDPANGTFRAEVDPNNLTETTMKTLKDCIEDNSGHAGKITVVLSSVVPATFTAVRTTSLELTQVAPGSAGNVDIVSSIKMYSTVEPIWHVGFFGGTGGTQILGITGSAVNDSTDLGIPRLSGSVYKRVTFEDLLYCDDLYGLQVDDNEPHPEACLLYGNAMWNKVIERPPTFGKMNRDDTLKSVGVQLINENRDLFQKSMLPFKSAIHNFAAETVNFFMHDQKLETIVSPPIKVGISDDRLLGKEFKMRVYLQNANTAMYDRHSAFGPPVDDGTNDMVYYENTALAIPASATLHFRNDPDALYSTVNSTKTVAEVAADPSLFTNAAPTHAQLQVNPSVDITTINSLEEQAAAGKIYFFDPANYFQTHTTPAQQAYLWLTHSIDGFSTVANANVPVQPWKAAGAVGSIPDIAANPYNVTIRPAGTTQDLKITYYDPMDYIHAVQYRVGNGTAPVDEVKAFSYLQPRDPRTVVYQQNSNTGVITGEWELPASGPTSCVRSAGPPIDERAAVTLTSTDLPSMFPGFDLKYRESLDAPAKIIFRMRFFRTHATATAAAEDPPRHDRMGIQVNLACKHDSSDTFIGDWALGFFSDNNGATDGIGDYNHGTNPWRGQRIGSLLHSTNNEHPDDAGGYGVIDPNTNQRYTGICDLQSNPIRVYQAIAPAGSSLYKPDLRLVPGFMTDKGAPATVGSSAATQHVYYMNVAWNGLEFENEQIRRVRMADWIVRNMNREKDRVEQAGLSPSSHPEAYLKDFSFSLDVDKVKITYNPTLGSTATPENKSLLIIGSTGNASGQGLPSSTGYTHGNDGTANMFFDTTAGANSIMFNNGDGGAGTQVSISLNGGQIIDGQGPKLGAYTAPVTAVEAETCLRAQWAGTHKTSFPFYSNTGDDRYTLKSIVGVSSGDTTIFDDSAILPKSNIVERDESGDALTFVSVRHPVHHFPSNFDNASETTTPDSAIINFRHINGGTVFNNGNTIAQGSSDSMHNYRIVSLGKTEVRRKSGSDPTSLRESALVLGHFGSSYRINEGSIVSVKADGTLNTSEANTSQPSLTGLPGADSNRQNPRGMIYSVNNHVGGRYFNGISIGGRSSKLKGRKLVTFEFCHPWDSNSEAANYGLDGSANADLLPKTRVDYGDSYPGYHSTNICRHLYAQFRKGESGGPWHTVMEIVPGAVEFKNWTPAGFVVTDEWFAAPAAPKMFEGSVNNHQADEIGPDADDTDNIYIRIVAQGNDSGASEIEAVWLIRNIQISEFTTGLASHSTTGNGQFAQNYRSQRTMGAIDGYKNTRNKYWGVTTEMINTFTQMHKLKLIQDTAGTAGNHTDNFRPGTSYINTMATTDAVFNNNFAFGAAGTSAKVYYDVTGSQPGHDLANNIRYVAQRPTASMTPMYTATEMRDLFKEELDSLNTDKLLNTLVTTTNDSTDKLTVSQRFGGEKGNNNPGPGKLLVNDGSQSGQTAARILTNPASSIFAGGGVGDLEIQPVTRSVPDMHGFMPYVPPYLDRNASPYVEYTWRPLAKGTYSAIDIVEQLTASYVNFHKTPENYATNSNYLEAMSLSASLNLTELVRLGRDKLVVDPLSGDTRTADSPRLGWHLMHDQRIVSPSNSEDIEYAWRWAIQPKWETPVHDFKNVSVDSLKLKAQKTGIVNNVNDTEFSVNQTVEGATGSPWKDRNWETYYQEFNLPPANNYLTASTGMWHQYGDDLKTNLSLNGYYLRIEDVGDYGLASTAGFLDSPQDSLERTGDITKVKWLKTPQRTEQNLSVKLGKIADSKEISEAVVAIPYHLDDSCKVNFFDLNMEHYIQAKSNIEIGQDNLIAQSLQARNTEEIRESIKEYERVGSYSSTTAVSTVEYQLRMMHKYILPPVFDFERVNDIDRSPPFVMYFFEFNAELDSKDLSNIWQNIYPESSDSTATPRYSNLAYNTPSKKDVVYSSHILDHSMVQRLSGDGSSIRNSSNYFDPNAFLGTEVRWLVVKCKRRAENDYSYIIDRSFEPTVYFEKLTQNRDLPPSLERSSRKGSLNLPVAYNWPYDYFSFVELIKLESKVDFYSLGAKTPPRNPFEEE